MEIVGLVADDGVGGVDLEAGSGLRGLQDRLATVGGTLTLKAAGITQSGTISANTLAATSTGGTIDLNNIGNEIANASFKRQRRNQAVTEIEQVPNRGHSLTIDSGWREVAEHALAFVKRFV